jgi:proteasome lid subunit RPN8/RPN11
MLEVNELSYAAIITIELPGMGHPATVSLTLSPPDVLETAPGQYKALRECTLADIQAFAEAIEAKIWEQYRHANIDELATDVGTQIKITLINESGKALALSREQVLEHAIQLTGPPHVTPPPASEPGASVEKEAPDEASTTGELGADTDDSSDAEERVPEPEAALSEQEHPDAEEAPSEVDAAHLNDIALRDGRDVSTGDRQPPEHAPEAMRIAGLRRPLGHSTPAAVDILMNEPPMREAQSHALSSMDREVAGMLIGPRPEKQPDGRYVVHITDIIVARHTRMMGASVTYTPESWRYVTDQLQERYPNEQACIVGWYHTHPGFGIFLSGMDLFIHQNFFTQIWHVALVLDPRAVRMGFFCWNRAQSEVRPYDFPWPEWAADGW